MSGDRVPDRLEILADDPDADVLCARCATLTPADLATQVGRDRHGDPVILCPSCWKDATEDAIRDDLPPIGRLPCGCPTDSGCTGWHPGRIA